MSLAARITPTSRSCASGPLSRKPFSRKPSVCTLAAKAGEAKHGAKYGMFVSSGSPAVAEVLSHSGVDWICLDMQHGAVGHTELAGLLQATASGRAKTIVRVGGPSDRFGIQQALDQGASGVMVPLVNSVAEAREAVSYCRFPPEGCRSVVAPSRALLTQEGFGTAALSRYLANANKKAQVWLQVESVECLDALDDILSKVPGIDCMFLGPADMACSMGLVPTTPTPDGAPAPRSMAAVLGGKEMAAVHEKVVATCRRHGVAAGCFTLGPAAAKQMVSLGYSIVAFDVDLNMAISTTAAAMAQLKA